MKLQRQKVKRLPGATAAVEALVDYKLNKGYGESGKKSKDKLPNDK